MKYFLFSLLTILVGTLILGLFWPRSFVIRPELSAEKPEKITIVLGGDVMLNRGVEYKLKEEGLKFAFSEIADYLRGADISFCNLESVISDKGYNVGSEYSFRADPEALEALTYAGFDIVSVANNHAFDYTREAFKDSLERLKEAGIDYVGGGFTEKEAFSLKVKEAKGVKVGFLAYTNLGPETWKAKGENSGIAQIKDFKEIEKDIKKADKEVDILIVSFHAGEEYAPEPVSFQKSAYSFFAESGADIIVGHHPHVMQPEEKHKGSFIFYSLGNFVFDQAFSEETMEGLILEVEIKGKEIAKVNSRKIKISERFKPYFE